MNEYHKIKSVYKREMGAPYGEHKKRYLLEGQWSSPEFEYLQHNKWVFTEKVNGTNIRVMWDHEESKLEFRGRTDKAQIPPHLYERLDALLPVQHFLTFFPDTSVCFYGEGYGPKINGGGKYVDVCSFVLFDVKIAHWWLRRDDVKDIAENFMIDVVPIIGRGTLLDMVGYGRNGFASRWNNGEIFYAEGLVARPEIELKARSGERIITKIKYEDFPHE